MIQSEKLLTNIGTTQYTLTVTTNPSSATCTLTYNGESYNSKTAIVPSGTTVSYTIYHATYGTATGSIIMDSDKTLTCNGTYSTSTTDINWTRPDLTSNGTWGGSSGCAVKVDGTIVAGKAYYIVDSDTNSFCALAKGLNYWYFYTPTPIKVSKMSWVYKGPGSGTHTAYIYGSNNDSSWTQLGSCSFKNANATIQTPNPSVSITNTNYFKYFRLKTETYTYSQYIGSWNFTAKYQKTSYTYYWNKTIS